MLLQYRIIISLLFLSSLSFAQNGCFTIDHPKGSAPLTIQVDNSCSVSQGYGSFQYDYEGTNSFGFATSHTYTTTGIFDISQFSAKGGTTDLVTVNNMVEVVAPLMPNVVVHSCKGKQLQIELLDSYYTNYVIDWGDGAIQNTAGSQTITHTYASIGAINLSIKGEFFPTDNGGQFQDSYTIFDVLPTPDINTLILDLGKDEVELKATLLPYIDYELLEGSNLTSLAMIQTIANETTFTTTISRGDYASTTYYYSIQSLDYCGGANNTSDTLQTIGLSVSKGDKEMNVQWDNLSFGQFNQQELSVNTTMLYQQSTATQFTHTDTAIECGTNYCYELKTERNGNRILETMITKGICELGESTTPPSAPTNVNSSIVGETLLLSWVNQSSFKEFYLNGALTTLNATDTVYSIPFIEEENCFTISLVDDCANTSITSKESCVIQLSLENDGSLAWTPYQGYDDNTATGYQVEWLDENGTVLKVEDVGNRFSYLDSGIDTAQGDLYYRIRSSPPSPYSFVSYSNIVKLDKELKLYFPTAFSPNGDGINDEFKVVGMLIEKYELHIFDAWGNEVFTTSDVETGWDGMIDGSLGNVGTYAYTVTAQDKEGNVVKDKGSFQLLP